MKLSDFYYELPPELVAQEPTAQRSGSRLLVLDRGSGNIEHRIFSDLGEYLHEGECLVLNDTRVIPARLLGAREDTGGRIEFVLLRSIREDTWEVILKPGKRARPGTRFVFGGGELKAEVVDVVEGGNRIVRFEYNGIFIEVLDKIGIIPLPPYITRKLEDPERYQTVYSRHKGSAAAPTAGLHFTEAMLENLARRGIRLAYLTLHVGLGTFRPVKTVNVEEHVMHEEYYALSAETAGIINDTRAKGGRVAAVGTTSCRVLETAGSDTGNVKPGEGMTGIFIYPGYHFKVTDALITNFHLPESTLIMLVSAFAGRENIMGAYREAIEKRYRFFSFGDAMLII